jgi:hypothetical protein
VVPDHAPVAGVTGRKTTAKSNNRYGPEAGIRDHPLKYVKKWVSHFVA